MARGRQRRAGALPSARAARGQRAARPRAPAERRRRGGHGRAAGVPARRLAAARGAYASLTGALRDPACPGGNFALRFDGDDRFSRGLTRWYALQRRFGVYYGDSTLWLRRADFEGLGGFAELPVMEDHELVRRLERRGRTACLPGPALDLAAALARARLVADGARVDADPLGVHRRGAARAARGAVPRGALKGTAFALPTSMRGVG